MSIKQSVKELTLISYLLFFNNSRDCCASSDFRQLPPASASQSWYARNVRDLALEVVKEKISDPAANNGQTLGLGSFEYR